MPRLDTTHDTPLAAVSVTALRKPTLSRLLPYLLIAPTLVFVVAFTLWPAAQSLLASFYKPGRGASDPATFVGLQNYLDLFNPTHFVGGRFAQVLRNTLIFALATVIISTPLSLLFAVLLNRQSRLRAWWRFSLFYPALLPFIGAASLWAFIFADVIGLANTVLATFGIGGPNWIGSPATVLLTVTVVNIWKQSSYYTIFYLAGLQGLPRDIYEAAQIEGAGDWQQFRFLTLPLLRRTTLFILIVAFTFGFQTVEHLPALGQGGPGDSSNLLLYLIFQTIPERRNWGYVNAMTVLMVIILLAFTVSNLAVFERGKEDERG
jgi:sn-glycerol 3-phosphate transport system permease protein